MKLSLARQLVVVPLLFPFGEFDCSLSVKTTPPPASEFVEISFLVTPYFDSITIDNVRVMGTDSSTSTGQRLTCQLPVGAHKVSIESHCCIPDEFTITVPDPGTRWAPLSFRRRLESRPAELTFETGLREFEVWIDGRYTGVCRSADAQVFQVPVGAEGRRTLQLLLMHSRLGDARRKVTVKAGQRTTVKISRGDFR